MSTDATPALAATAARSDREAVAIPHIHTHTHTRAHTHTHTHTHTCTHTVAGSEMDDIDKLLDAIGVYVCVRACLFACIFVFCTCV